MVIIDSQVHVWMASRPDRPWLPGAVAQRPEPLEYPDLRKQMQQAGVDRAVLVPPNWEGDRLDHALEAAQKFPDTFAVMGRLTLLSPDAPRLIETWMSHKGMLGIRATFHRPDEQPLLTNGSIDWFWPAANRLRIPLMVHAPRGIDALGKIAASYPELKIIVDHMGLERESVDDAMGAGIDRTITLARYPNVSVKVSAVPCFSTQPYPFRNIHTHVKRLIEAFGPRRCFWGTDLTRLRADCSYRQAVTVFTEEMDFLSAEDKEWIMGRGVCEWLGWKY